MVEQLVTVPKSGDTALLHVPNSVSSGQPIDLVYYLHGRTGTCEVMNERHHLRDALLAAGYAVAARNCTATNGATGWRRTTLSHWTNGSPRDGR